MLTIGLDSILIAYNKLASEFEKKIDSAIDGGGVRNAKNALGNLQVLLHAEKEFGTKARVPLSLTARFLSKAMAKIVNFKTEVQYKKVTETLRESELVKKLRLANGVPTKSGNKMAQIVLYLLWKLCWPNSRSPLWIQL